MVQQILLQLLNGLVVGSGLALVASGLALLFGVLGLINFAQGDFFMLGGYVLYFTIQRTGNFALGALLAFVIIGVGGGLLLQGMVWPLQGKSEALVLLATLGLSLIIQQVTINVIGGAPTLVPPPITGVVELGSFIYPVYDLVIVLVAVVLLVAGFFALQSTKYGIWLRAVAENRPMAAALGVPVVRVFFIALIVSSALAGLAGAMLVPVTSLYPTIGNDIILNAFIIVVAGGLGNLKGAALVALLLGEVQSLGSIVIPPVQVELVLFALVILMMIRRARPQAALVRL